MRGVGADDAVIGLAKCRKRQRVRRGAIEGEEHLAAGLKQRAKSVRRFCRPAIVTVGRRMAEIGRGHRRPGLRANAGIIVARELLGIALGIAHLAAPPPVHQVFAIKAKLTQSVRRYPVCCRTGRISPLLRGYHLAREQVGVERQPNS